MTKLKEKFGKRLEELLNKKNIKQCELAEKLNIDAQSISRLVSGKHFPKEENIEKITTALNIKEKDLFTFSHLNTDKELIREINDFLKNASSEKIRIAHRIIETIVE